MVWIHQLPEWPAFFWDDAALAGALAAVRHRQGRHLGRMEALGFEVRRAANAAVLAEEVVKSWAIEGERLDRAEVRSSIARRLGLDAAGLPAPGRAVDGAVEMTLDATRDWERPLTAERLFGWHAALFPTGRSGMARITTGAWRTDAGGPMQVVSGPAGRERVHFQAPAAARLGAEMTRFLTWFASPPAIDPVLRAGVAHFWFVTIHPFDDGNGRIGRAIAELALAQADGVRERFYSLASAIEARRRAYYRRLEASQRGSLDLTLWLTWFLECLDHAVRAAGEQLDSVLYRARLWQRIDERPVNPRQRRVVNRMLDDFAGHMTTSKYAKLAKCSTDTALRDLRGLLERGIMVRNPPGGRSTSYRLAPL